MRYLFLLLALPSALFALTVGETVPSLQLTDKVLTNVTVRAITPTYIMATWDGGQGTIARKYIPSFPAEKVVLRPKVTAPKVKVPVKLAIATPATEERPVPLNQAELDLWKKPTTDLTPETLPEVLINLGKFRQSRTCPTVLRTYETGVSYPFSKLGTHRVNLTLLERQGASDVNLAFNSVASFDGIEIPYTERFNYEITKPNYAPVPGLLAGLSRSPKYTHLILMPDTVVLYTPYQLLSYTYGRDLDTVIRIKAALGNHIPPMFWQQPVPIITSAQPLDDDGVICIGKNVKSSVEGYYSIRSKGPLGFAGHMELLKKFPGAATMMSHILVHIQPNNYTYTGTEQTEIIIQHEMSHLLDSTTHSWPLIRKGHYAMDYALMSEFYVLASLLNRANYLLFGEPITTKEQAMNMLGLALEHACKEHARLSQLNPYLPSPVTIPNINNLPEILTRPPQYFSTLPIGIRESILWQLNNYSVPASAIQNPDIASAWISFYCILAM